MDGQTSGQSELQSRCLVVLKKSKKKENHISPKNQMQIICFIDQKREK